MLGLYFTNLLVLLIWHRHYKFFFSRSGIVRQSSRNDHKDLCTKSMQVFLIESEDMERDVFMLADKPNCQSYGLIDIVGNYMIVELYDIHPVLFPDMLGIVSSLDLLHIYFKLNSFLCYFIENIKAS